MFKPWATRLLQLKYLYSFVSYRLEAGYHFQSVTISLANARKNKTRFTDADRGVKVLFHDQVSTRQRNLTPGFIISFVVAGQCGSPEAGRWSLLTPPPPTHMCLLL